MQGHGLMQAIARVNRVFRDKPGGLVVDYLGLADQLKKALATYTDSGGRGAPTYDTAQAIAVMLEKLLKDELKVRARHNVVQSTVFSDKLKKTLNAYHNRAISTLEVIEELITLAREMEAATRRGQDLGLTDDEVAFYDALAANGSAVQAMGDDKLKLIAAELITQVRKSVTIDWTLREGARAKIRVMVKRILNKYGYPPDLQQEAVKTVLRQAELLSAMWAIA
jgi:type I restriction enzyme R subunit